MSKPIKIVIASDNSIVRKGIAKILSEDASIQIVAELKGGQEVIRAMEVMTPDILLVDYFLPELNGVDLSCRLSKNKPHIKIAIFSTKQLSYDCIHKAMRAGISTFLDKTSAHGELILAINAMAGDEPYVSPSIATKILKSMCSPLDSHNSHAKGNQAKLTHREIEIIQLIAEGLTNKEIAQKLFISHKTVRNHRANLMEKLNLRNAADITKYAIKTKMVDIHA